MVKTNPKIKFGIAIQDISPEMKAQYERNTGAFVDIVFEDSAAFYANILPGDIIISVDGTSIKNTSHALELMALVPPNAASSKLVILRKGEQKSIEVKF